MNITEIGWSLVSIYKHAESMCYVSVFFFIDVIEQCRERNAASIRLGLKSSNSFTECEPVAHNVMKKEEK